MAWNKTWICLQQKWLNLAVSAFPYTANGGGGHLESLISFFHHASNLPSSWANSNNCQDSLCIRKIPQIFKVLVPTFLHGEKGLQFLDFVPIIFCTICLAWGHPANILPRIVGQLHSLSFPFPLLLGWRAYLSFPCINCVLFCRRGFRWPRDRKWGFLTRKAGAFFLEGDNFTGDCVKDLVKGGGSENFFPEGGGQRMRDRWF